MVRLPPSRLKPKAPGVSGAQISEPSRTEPEAEDEQAAELPPGSTHTSASESTAGPRQQQEDEKAPKAPSTDSSLQNVGKLSQRASWIKPSSSSRSIGNTPTSDLASGQRDESSEREENKSTASSHETAGGTQGSPGAATQTSKSDSWEEIEPAKQPSVRRWGQSSASSMRSLNRSEHASSVPATASQTETDKPEPSNQASVRRWVKPPSSSARSLEKTGHEDDSATPGKSIDKPEPAKQPSLRRWGQPLISSAMSPKNKPDDEAGSVASASHDSPDKPEPAKQPSVRRWGQPLASSTRSLNKSEHDDTESVASVTSATRVSEKESEVAKRPSVRQWGQPLASRSSSLKKSEQKDTESAASIKSPSALPTETPEPTKQPSVRRWGHPVAPTTRSLQRPEHEDTESIASATTSPNSPIEKVNPTKQPSARRWGQPLTSSSTILDKSEHEVDDSEKSKEAPATHKLASQASWIKRDGKITGSEESDENDEVKSLDASYSHDVPDQVSVDRGGKGIGGDANDSIDEVAPEDSFLVEKVEVGEDEKAEAEEMEAQSPIRLSTRDNQNDTKQPVISLDILKKTSAGLRKREDTESTGVIPKTESPGLPPWMMERALKRASFDKEGHDVEIAPAIERHGEEKPHHVDEEISGDGSMEELPLPSPVPVPESSPSPAPMPGPKATPAPAPAPPSPKAPAASPALAPAPVPMFTTTPSELPSSLSQPTNENGAPLSMDAAVPQPHVLTSAPAPTPAGAPAPVPAPSSMATIQPIREATTPGSLAGSINADDAALVERLGKWLNDFGGGEASTVRSPRPYPFEIWDISRPREKEMPKDIFHREEPAQTRTSDQAIISDENDTASGQIDDERLLDPSSEETLQDTKATTGQTEDEATIDKTPKAATAASDTKEDQVTQLSEEFQKETQNQSGLPPPRSDAIHHEDAEQADESLRETNEDAPVRSTSETKPAEQQRPSPPSEPVTPAVTPAQGYQNTMEGAGSDVATRPPDEATRETIKGTKAETSERKASPWSLLCCGSQSKPSVPEERIGQQKTGKTQPQVEQEPTTIAEPHAAPSGQQEEVSVPLSVSQVHSDLREHDVQHPPAPEPTATQLQPVSRSEQREVSSSEENAQEHEVAPRSPSTTEAALNPTTLLKETSGSEREEMQTDELVIQEPQDGKLNKQGLTDNEIELQGGETQASALYSKEETPIQIADGSIKQNKKNEQIDAFEDDIEAVREDIKEKESETEESKERTSFWLLICLMLLCCILIALVIFAILIWATGTIDNPFRGDSEPPDFVGEIPTTPMDSHVPGNCDFSEQIQPHVITQCRCNGEITRLTDDARQKYDALVSEFLVPNVFPNWEFPIESCAAANQALVWLSTTYASDQQDLLHKYILPYLYFATNGPDWNIQTAWLTDEDECKWYGIFCSDSDSIQIIDLESNSLLGMLPTQLRLLTSLETLSFFDNSLSGTIPVQLYNLPNLTMASFSKNRLYGTIPIEVGEASRLELLYLDNNQMDGTLTSELGSMTRLQELNLGYNSFDNEIPTELYLLTDLIFLSLESNFALSGRIPTEFSDYRNLRFLSISDTSIRGKIPTEFSSLTDLQELHMANTLVGGNIPRTLVSLSNLSYLDLSGSRFRGPVPSIIGSLAELEYLVLNDNSLEGWIPPQFGNLTKLKTLLLHGNDFDGSMPSELGLLTNLQTLMLEDNALTGRAPEEICDLREIELEIFTVDCPALAEGVVCPLRSCCSSCRTIPDPQA